jgi:TonB family protein
MSDSGARSHFTPMSLAANPLRFATAVSLGLHAVVFAWFLDAPKPVGLDSNPLIDAVSVELVARNEIAASPAAAGSVVDSVSRQVTAAPTTEEKTFGNGSTSQPKAPPPEETTSVPEHPFASIRESMDTAQNVVGERPEAVSDATTERRPIEASDSSTDHSIAEAEPIDHPPPTPKPVTSEPKLPAAKHQLENRKPVTEQHSKSASSAIKGQAGLANSVNHGAVATATGKNDLLASYMASIRAKIVGQQSSKPSEVRGQVKVRFNVAADGRLYDLKVEKSDDDSLEEEALRIIRRSSPAAPIPPSAGETSLTMSVVMEFN